MTKLVISYNEIGDLGACYLAKAIAHNNSMTHINLDNNQINAQGIKILFQAIRHNNSLTDISFDHNKGMNPVIKGGIDNITDRNKAYLNNTKKFLEQNFPDDKVISQLNVSSHIKDFKILQIMNENILRTKMLASKWICISRAKSYLQDKWFEAYGVCKNFESDLSSEFSFFALLPLELRNHIVSFLGTKSLWQIDHIDQFNYDEAIHDMKVVTAGNTSDSTCILS